MRSVCRITPIHANLMRRKSPKYIFSEDHDATRVVGKACAFDFIGSSHGAGTIDGPELIR
jgi:hypothetical protein